MTDQKTPSTPRKSLLKRLGIAGIALLVLLIINIIAISMISIDQVSRQNPAFCGACHIMESRVSSYMNSTNMDNIHRQANVGCKDCHANYSLGDEVKSLWQYVTGNYEKILSKRKVEDSMCTQCHISLQYHANRTDFLVRNPHLSHWPELRCASCHISHDKQVDYCSRCHENGGQRMTGDKFSPRAKNPWATPKK